MIPALAYPTLPAMTDDQIDLVCRAEEALHDAPQTEITTNHLFHAGMYARTMRLPAGNVLVGALVKVPTVVFFSGEADVFIGDQTIRLSGFHVIPADAMRKQMFLAHTDCDITAIFPTDAKTVEAAEAQATDKPDTLLSRRNRNILADTRSKKCLTQP